ncbi:MAG: hypothetical protein CVV13_10530 [Gammaproteobacteria bacterium HGW-Gammaproteobacteria-3]|nr:MAG: hypothetical protein CVV13_10530 [Gammaproteobacteria bacterium HGW-Gammaproteobacteria-3]
MALLLKFIFFTLWVLLQACGHQPVAAPSPVSVTAEGQAPIVNNNKARARQQALQDAIRQASLQGSVTLKSETSVSDNSVQSDRFTLRTAASVSASKVIDEWEDNAIYHVRAAVTLSASDLCTPQFRKRIIATAFPLVQPGHLSSAESTDISSGMPREIMYALAESGAFIGINHTRVSLYAQPELAPNLDENAPVTVSGVMKVAADEGGQLVLSGVIRDLQIESTDYVRGSGVTAWVKSVAREVWAKRNIVIDIYVHDGFTGALLTQRRYTGAVSGDVWIPASYSVGSEGFRDTATGAELSRIMAQADVDIGKALSCYPFAARIIKIDQDNVFIDAGAEENIQVGDKFEVYADVGAELNPDGNRQFIGADKQVAGVLTVNAIKPRYAIGTMESPPFRLGIRAGDWVRPW